MTFNWPNWIPSNWMIDETLYWLLGGIVIGILIGWAVARLRAARPMAAQAARLAVAESRLERLTEMESSLLSKEEEIDALSERITELVSQRTALSTRLEQEQVAAEEKINLLKSLRANLTDTYQALAAEALRENSRSFLDLAGETFSKYMNVAEKDLELRGDAVKDVVRPMQEALSKYEEQMHQMELSRKGAYVGLKGHLDSLVQSQTALQKETGKLAQAMRVPNVRGRWGEMTLKRAVELAGMAEHCDFTEQTTFSTENGAMRPDLIVYLPNGRQIAVDAKVPLAAFLEAMETETESEQIGHLQNHARMTADHVNLLAKKAYWQHLGDTTDFVVMFIPGDNFFAAALNQRPDLLETAAAKNVILTTPTTLIALLKTVALGWQQAKAAENAQLIGEIGQELYDRLTTLFDTLARLGKSLDKSTGDYNRLVNAFNHRVLVSAKRMKELGLRTQKKEPLEETALLENRPHPFASDSMTIASSDTEEKPDAENESE